MFSFVQPIIQQKLFKYFLTKTEDFSATNNPGQWRIQDFPGVGTPTLRGRQHTILPKFPKNCMKLKEFGPRGRVPCPP